MIGLFLITLAALALAAIFVNPKIGAILVWPVILLYPHLYMEQLAWLPWNAGIDDIYMAVFALVVLVRRNLLAGVPLRVGLTMVGALTYGVVWTVSNLHGWTLMPDLLPIEILKPILKYITFLAFAYGMVHTLDTPSDLRRVSAVFVVVMTLAGVTVILHQLFPAQFWIFTSETLQERERIAGEVVRAAGALQNVNTGCTVLGMCVLFALTQIRSSQTFSRKFLLTACLPILILAIVMTESRSGALAMGVALLGMFAASRHRWYSAALVSFVAMGVMLRPDVVIDYAERIASTYSSTAGGQLEQSAAYRINAWRDYAEMSTPAILLLGQGFDVGVERIGLHAHSNYISALFVHGVGGAIWFVVFFFYMFRRAWWVRVHAADPMKSIASGVIWALIAYLVAGLTLDLLSGAYPRYVVLFFAALIERSYALARAQAQSPSTMLLQQQYGSDLFRRLHRPVPA